MTAILRGTAKSGYRTSTPVECPHCQGAVHLSGNVAEDRQGKHLVLWPVERAATEYDDATLDGIYAARPTAAQTGVQWPQAPGRVDLVDDPVPAFSGETDGQ